ncbi:hypothetical protein KGF56_000024 [Candida oxycetoniae]|uniref:Uncharacterized protein n=1 Tax=Candida oxycetoniae TaxID=497107 RepID=A0AAI9T1F0_9ASCO|nr:uncharacterized protein KGF56_000024 [Candida oxycetoniae]KAI3407123.2 hypothetical protein KGF56_000024 [Candida oxycetoniae]
MTVKSKKSVSGNQGHMPHQHQHQHQQQQQQQQQQGNQGKRMNSNSYNNIPKVRMEQEVDRDLLSGVGAGAGAEFKKSSSDSDVDGGTGGMPQQNTNRVNSIHKGYEHDPEVSSGKAFAQADEVEKEDEGDEDGVDDDDEVMASTTAVDFQSPPPSSSQGSTLQTKDHEEGKGLVSDSNIFQEEEEEEEEEEREEEGNRDDEEGEFGNLESWIREETIQLIPQFFKPKSNNRRNKGQQVKMGEQLIIMLTNIFEVFVEFGIVLYSLALFGLKFWIIFLVALKDLFIRTGGNLSDVVSKGIRMK